MTATFPATLPATFAARPAAATRRVLLVGSGRRIRNNFLPALAHLDDPVDLTGVWSPTPGHAAAAAGPWSAPVAPTLAEGLAGADTVIVSVKTAAVPGVLAELEGAAATTHLVLDTPVFGRAEHLLHLPLLERFASVTVAEDYMQFPQWALVRAAVDAGLVGPVHAVELAHSGFRYHGLALVRSVYGFPFARSLRRRRRGGDTQFEFRFGRTRRGLIVEPYDQERGRTVVAGERGMIVHRHGARSPAPPGTGVPVYDVAFDDSGPVPAFALADLRLELPHLPALLEAPVPDRSVFNALKTCGLMTVLSSSWSATTAAARPGSSAGPGCSAGPGYSYRQALYDHLVTAALRQVPGAVDPFASLGRNFVDVLRRAASLAAASRHRHPPTTSPAIKEER